MNSKDSYLTDKNRPQWKLLQTVQCELMQMQVLQRI